MLVVAGWVNRQQQDVIDYLQKENCVLRAGLRGKRVVSKNTNELKTGAPGHFGLEVSRLGWQWKLKSSVMSTPIQPLTWLAVAIAGWTSVTNRQLSFTCLRRTESSKLGFAGGSFAQTLADPG